jgi:hypothetical protein
MRIRGMKIASEQVPSLCGMCAAVRQYGVSFLSGVFAPLTLAKTRSAKETLYCRLPARNTGYVKKTCNFAYRMLSVMLNDREVNGYAELFE